MLPDMSSLFAPLRLRELNFRNRVFVSPMCQYSSTDGLAGPWHLVHLGSRAVGGAALVITEAAAVVPEGRISPHDLGIWSAAHAQALQPIATFVREQGAVAGIQLAHAGRKASTARPWEGGGAVAVEQGGWEPVAPSAVSYSGRYWTPRELTRSEILQLPRQFAEAAERSLGAGFQVIEVHAAHGYLLHQFLSPLSNLRHDEYGGDFEGRIKLPLEVVRAVRDAVPRELPLFVRISATDWAPGGWDLAQSIDFAKRLQAAGVDLVDCSSGGLVPSQQITVGPGYQVPFAEAIRREAKIATGAVGLITEAAQAEAIIESGQADAVLLARAFLRDPYWTKHASVELGATSHWPVQYGRA
jgi:2,4-dienoyl-CoA reductase-like NADH-dependent reductase (Old Yellow Enzyme family)